MNNLKYSIIYAIIRPEIAERISVGLIFVDGEKVDMNVGFVPKEALTDFVSKNL